MMIKVAAMAGMAALAATSVRAACPNACSGHGTCGEYDMCTCYQDWEGGDCSQRSCPVGFAWVTTNANGDINADGDVNDLTMYDTDHYFSVSGIPYVTSQANPAGAWEQWPAFANTGGTDEGHFYMECSNRGVCDREVGECQCFQGYTGAACQRARCPNDCSGHGVCKSAAQLAVDAGFTYSLWDKDMTRGCSCDAGYSGPDCSQRKCPKGDDPMTTSQTYETNWVDVYTDRDGTNNNAFAGYIRFKYTDHTGKQWTTDRIAVEPYSASPTTDMAAAAAAALNGLPNDVLKDVSVSVGYADRVIPGTVAIASGTIAASSTTWDPSTKLVRCPTQAAHTIVYGASQLDFDGSTGSVIADGTGLICREVEHQWSLRFTVTFPSTPGNLQNLDVDISEVTVGGLANSQRLANIVFKDVKSQLVMASDDATGGHSISHTVVGDGSLTESCVGTTAACGVTASTKTVSLGTGSGTAPVFVTGSRVKITCTTDASGATLLGEFTVATMGTDDFTVTEDIPDCVTSAGSEGLTVVRLSAIFESNANLVGTLSVGQVISSSALSSDTSKVSKLVWDSTNVKTYIFLEEAYSATVAATTAGTDTILIQGDATTEKTECSDRGICNRETGVCRCFKGYTGAACSLQNALSV